MIKIAIIGAESTGKTTLCKKLAQRFDAKWEQELAREYVENLGREYNYDDVVKIAQQQIEQEKKYEQDSDKFVFFDTDLIITKVWLEHKYGKVPPFVLERLEKKFFDFYLLCEPDIEWEYDPVRENADNRDFFTKWYKKEIEKLGTPYKIVKGKGEKRTENAVKYIADFQKKKR